MPSTSINEHYDAATMFSSSNIDDCFEMINGLFKLRHNIIHELVLFEVVGRTGINERSLKDLGFIGDDDYLKQTPDIIFVKRNKDIEVWDGLLLGSEELLLIVDISVSQDTSSSFIKKKDKYNDLATFLKNFSGVETKVFPFAVFPTLFNYDSVMTELLKVLGIDRNFVRHIFEEYFQLFQGTCAMIDDIFKNSSNPNTIRSMLKNQFDISEKFDPAIEIEKKEQIKQSFVNAQNVIMENCNERGLKYNDLTRCDDSISISVEGLADIIEELLCDNEILLKYGDTVADSAELHNAKKDIDVGTIDIDGAWESKPSIHVYTPLDPVELIGKRNDIPLEQSQILAFSEFILKNTPQSTDVRISFLQFLTKSIMKSSEVNLHTFCNGHFLKTDVEEEESKREYHEYRSQAKSTNTKNVSFIDYLQDIGKIHFEREDPYFSRQKTVKVNLNSMDSESTQFFSRAHINLEKTIKESNLPVDLKLSCAPLCDVFINQASEICEERPIKKLYDIMATISKIDASANIEIKDQISNCHTHFISMMSRIKAFRWAYNQSLVYDQLCHFSQLSLPKSNISVFTAGIDGFLGICANNYFDKGKDVGKAFMFAWITDKAESINPLFGKISTVRVTSNLYLCVTNWRRLTSTKLTFAKDVFYSVLSTFYTTWERRSAFFESIGMYTGEYNIEMMTLLSDMVKGVFMPRLLIGMSTRQRVAEMASDMRYVLVDSLSDLSNVRLFINDKLSGPYSSILEAWIVSRIDNAARIRDVFVTNPDCIKVKEPQFRNNVRVEGSIGIEMDLPSLWGDHDCVSAQDLLDDMFLYVHTVKEPSNIHHENVKSMKTIIEYQKKYDNLDEKFKTGKFTNINDFKEFLMTTGLGHNKYVTQIGSELIDMSIDHDKCRKKCWDFINEPLADITSTKASIPEHERISLSDIKTTTKRQKKIQKSLFNLTKKDSIFMERKATSVKTNYEKSLLLNRGIRAKVHDCMLDILLSPKTQDLTTVSDLGLWNINQNGSRSVADICIKAQYGAKREFYVINLGAKAMLRITENCFKEVATQLPEEMISVPGDKKILKMQSIVNSAFKDKKQGEWIYYVNGDCTKWSAAETMECFYNFLTGFKMSFPPEIIEYMKATILAWSNKDIAIPISILQNTYYTKSITSYLKDDMIFIRSTQNFLQGMFNYLSSVKAVACSRLLQSICKIKYKNTVFIEHMEHSDDYCIIIRCGTIEVLKEIRVIHKMLMRLMGMSDSVKKTNCQRLLMEFISLIGFNANMNYPHIKKTKEVGLNLGCTGYRDDMDMALSRVTEAIRIGVTLNSAYFMQKIHIFNVANAYSVLPGMANCLYSNIGDCMSNPVELFGIPDTNPLMGLLISGNTNSYRLYKYSKDSALISTIELLAKISISIQESMPTYDSDARGEGLRLFHPVYTFDQENKLIKKLRQDSKWSHEESNTFFTEHKPYLFIKPQSSKNLIKWMKSMYFKTNFALAYSRNSRSQITMRLSTYTNQECLIYPMIKDEQFKSMKIKMIHEMIQEYSICEDIETQVLDKLILLRMLANNDNICTTVYKWMEDAHLEFKCRRNLYTMAGLTPIIPRWVHISSDSSTLLQYIFAPEDMQEDFRRIPNYSSLEHDKAKIQSLYNVVLSKDSPVSIVKAVFSDIVSSKGKRNMCMVYNNQSNSLDSFLMNMIACGTFSECELNVTHRGLTESTNLHSGQPFLQRESRYIASPLLLLINDAGLILNYMNFKLKSDLEIMKTCISKLRITSDPSISIDVIKDYTVDDLRVQGFTSDDIKTAAVLQTVMFNRTSIVDTLHVDSSIYLYKYERPDSDDIKGGFKERVVIQYMGKKSIAKLHNNGNVILVMNSFDKSNIAVFYLIALKLFNKISKFQLESKMPIYRLLDIPTNISKDFILGSSREILSSKHKVLVKSFGKYFNYSMNVDDKSTVLPVFFQKERIRTILNDYDRLRHTITFSDSDLSFYSNNMKMFQLPNFTLIQSNMGFLTNITNNIEKKINWCLSYDIFRKWFSGSKINIPEFYLKSIEDLLYTTTVSEFHKDHIKHIFSELPKEKNLVEVDGLSDDDIKYLRSSPSSDTSSLKLDEIKFSYDSESSSIYGLDEEPDDGEIYVDLNRDESSLPLNSSHSGKGFVVSMDAISRVSYEDDDDEDEYWDESDDEEINVCNANLNTNNNVKNKDVIETIEPNELSFDDMFFGSKDLVLKHKVQEPKYELSSDDGGMDAMFFGDESEDSDGSIIQSNVKNNDSIVLQPGRTLKDIFGNMKELSFLKMNIKEDDSSSDGELMGVDEPDESDLIKGGSFNLNDMKDMIPHVMLSETIKDPRLGHFANSLQHRDDIIITAVKDSCMTVDNIARWNGLEIFTVLTRLKSLVDHLDECTRFQQLIILTLIDRLQEYLEGMNEIKVNQSFILKFFEGKCRLFARLDENIDSHMTEKILKKGGMYRIGSFYSNRELSQDTHLDSLYAPLTQQIVDRMIGYDYNISHLLHSTTLGNVADAYNHIFNEKFNRRKVFDDVLQSLFD